MNATGLDFPSAVDPISQALSSAQTESQRAAELLLCRRQARRQFRSWCQMLGYQPAKHHDALIKKLQEVAESETPRYVMILMPPGAAKSTYTSLTFIPWYLGFCVGRSILACSYSKDLAAKWGRGSRNLVEQHSKILGYSLSGDTRAADEWETSSGGRYFCAGVGAGIAGHRADLGLIDDYLGNQEDADSPTIRDKQWNWFLGDFYPRVTGTKPGQPGGSIVIIANRRHEDDLIGRLLAKVDNSSPIPPEKWEVLRFPFFAETNDPLGRQVGEVLWPEWFDKPGASKVEGIRRLPGRIRAGLYQQSPRPDDGDFFKSKWFLGYEPQDLPPFDTLQIYAASDFACSEEEQTKADLSCHLFGGWDGKFLWILPVCWWERDDTGQVVRAMLRYGDQYKPLIWAAEKGQIQKSIGPFLYDQMQEQQIYLRIEPVSCARDKPTRARPAEGMCEFGQVMFPKFAPWWGDAENELLTFPGGTHDDWVDAFAYLCALVQRMTKKGRGKDVVDINVNQIGYGITLKTLKDQSRRAMRDQKLIAQDR